MQQDLSWRHMTQLALASWALGGAIYAVYDLLMGVRDVSPWMFCDLLIQSLFVCGLAPWFRGKRPLLILQGVFLTLLLMGNALKVHFRFAPLMPLDVYMLNDLYLLVGPPVFVSAIVASLAPLAVWACWAARHAQKPRLHEALWVLAPVLFSVWLLGFPASYYATFDWLMRHSAVNTSFLMREKSERMGLMLTFSIELGRFLETQRVQPTAEDVRQAARVLRDWAPAPGVESGPMTRPNIYVLLSESFWDPDLLVHGSHPNFLDPNFRTLWTQTGTHYFVSPVVGGGTANAEFEMMCGIPFRAASKGTVFQSALSNPMPCLPALLRHQGYTTLAFHPYISGYYNRKHAFSLLGFDHFITQESFEQDKETGAYITDQSFINQSLTMAKRLSYAQPHFVYMMTFAGHWPFFWHNDVYQTRIQIRTNDPQGDEIKRHLNINHIASTALVEAVQTIRREDPTALIVMAGDHQPSLAADIATETRSQGTLTDPRYFMTPLLLLGPGNQSLVDRDIAAYELPVTLLRALHVPAAQQGYMPLFTQPATVFRRPIGGGVFLQLGTAPAICLKDNPNPPTACANAKTWFQAAKVIAADLVHGKQETLQLPRLYGPQPRDPMADDSLP